MKTSYLKLQITANLQKIYCLTSTFQGFCSDLLSFKFSRYFRKVYFPEKCLVVVAILVRFSKHSFPQKLYIQNRTLGCEKTQDVQHYQLVFSCTEMTKDSYMLFQIAIYSKTCSFLFIQLRRIQNPCKRLKRSFL